MFAQFKTKGEGCYSVASSTASLIASLTSATSSATASLISSASSLTSSAFLAASAAAFFANSAARLSGGLLGELGSALGLLGSLGLGSGLLGGELLGGLLGALLLGGCGTSELRGCGATELVGKALDASAGVNELLGAGVERVALVAQVDDDLALGGVRLPGVAAGAAHRALNVIRMDALLHVGLLRYVLVSDQDEGSYLLARAAGCPPQTVKLL